MKQILQLFVIASVSVISASIAGFLIGGVQLSLISSLATLMMLFSLKGVVKPRVSRPKMTLTVALVFIGFASSVYFSDNLLISILNKFSPEYFDFRIPTNSLVSKLTFVFLVGFVIFQLVKLNFSQTSVSLSEEADLTNAPKINKDYLEIRNTFCEKLVRTLRDIDEETNWSGSYYTDLEAEVEIPGSGRSTKIVHSLIAAIKKDKTSKSFLIIGEPGAGKSVSLRRLAQEMALEQKDKDEFAPIPLYVNLKEWIGTSVPTEEEIIEFTRKSVVHTLPREASQFINRNFDKLLNSGVFFFIFDSFDEMPVVLDTEEKSETIKSLAKLFNNLFDDLHGCRGVLASRPFRKPDGFKGRKLNIRPFSQSQVTKAMKNWLKGTGIDAKMVVKSIMVDKPHMENTLSNPFLGDLISQYITDFGMKLPENYFELFEHYINKRLDEDKSRLDYLGLKKEEVINAAVEIASTIFSLEDIGLEININTLKANTKIENQEQIISALKYSRLVRWGGELHESFSFVHRRFAEFFAVKHLLSNPDMLRFDSIPTDSRWRDGLVVYCSVAPVEKAQEIAEFTWHTIEKNKEVLLAGDLQNAGPAFHCVRFLKDAFRSRLHIIKDIQDEFSLLIDKLLTKSKQDLIAHLATESLVIVNSDTQEEGLKKSLSHEVDWIRDTAFNTGRLLKIPRRLEMSVIKTIKGLNDYDFIKKFNSLRFSFSLNNSYQRVLIFIRLKLITTIFIYSLFSVSFALQIYFNQWVPIIHFIFLYITISLLFLLSDELEESEERIEFSAIPFQVIIMAYFAVSLIPGLISFTFEYLHNVENPRIETFDSFGFLTFGTNFYCLILILTITELNLWKTLFDKKNQISILINTINKWRLKRDFFHFAFNAMKILMHFTLKVSAPLLILFFPFIMLLPLKSYLLSELSEIYINSLVFYYFFLIVTFVIISRQKLKRILTKLPEKIMNEIREFSTYCSGIYEQFKLHKQVFSGDAVFQSIAADAFEQAHGITRRKILRKLYDEKFELNNEAMAKFSNKGRTGIERELIAKVEESHYGLQ